MTQFPTDGHRSINRESVAVCALRVSVYLCCESWPEILEGLNCEQTAQDFSPSSQRMQNSLGPCAAKSAVNGFLERIERILAGSIRSIRSRNPLTVPRQKLNADRSQPLRQFACIRAALKNLSELCALCALRGKLVGRSAFVAGRPGARPAVATPRIVWHRDQTGRAGVRPGRAGAGC